MFVYMEALQQVLRVKTESHSLDKHLSVQSEREREVREAATGTQSSRIWRQSRGRQLAWQKRCEEAEE